MHCHTIFNLHIACVNTLSYSNLPIGFVECQSAAELTSSRKTIIILFVETNTLWARMPAVVNRYTSTREAICDLRVTLELFQIV